MSYSKSDDEENSTEFQEFLKQIATFESIHKIVTDKKRRRNLISLRVITPTKDPFTDSIRFETTNSLSPQSQTTLSLLTNISDSSKAPRFLLTYTNVKDEFYECELTYNELVTHRSDVSMDEMTWESYLKHLKDGLHKADDIQTRFTDESKDLLQLTINCPINSSIKLKYKFELVAVRDEMPTKLAALVFDLAHYTDLLFIKRTSQDEKEIEKLKAELEEVKGKLALAEQRAGNQSSEELFISSQKPKSKTLKKRKAPKSLLNPAQKRRKAKGAKIV